MTSVLIGLSPLVSPDITVFFWITCKKKYFKHTYLKIISKPLKHENSPCILIKKLFCRNPAVPHGASTQAAPHNWLPQLTIKYTLHIVQYCLSNLKSACRCVAHFLYCLRENTVFILVFGFTCSRYAAIVFFFNFKCSRHSTTLCTAITTSHHITLHYVTVKPSRTCKNSADRVIFCAELLCWFS